MTSDTSSTGSPDESHISDGSSTGTSIQSHTPDSSSEDAASGSAVETILRVHRYKTSTGAVKRFRSIQVGSVKDLKDKNLEFIRSLLVKENVFSSIG